MDRLSFSNPHGPNPLIGLLPAGGRAVRLGPLPCSKEIFPIGFEPQGPDGGLRVNVAATGLLQSMHHAGAERAFFILRQGKWDIPAYYGHGGGVKVHIGYLIADQPYGAPYTLDQAYPFIQNATILFGFPDILFRPRDAFVRLLERQSETKAPVVLGVFKTDNPLKVDMVGIDPAGRVREIVIKPQTTELKYTWLIAVWEAGFSRYLHDYLAEDLKKRMASQPNQSGTELFVGDVIRAAIEDHWTVQTVLFDQGAYLDVGTPEDMQRAMSDSSWRLGGKK